MSNYLHRMEYNGTTRDSYEEIAAALLAQREEEPVQEGVLIEVMGSVVTVSCGIVCFSRECAGPGIAQEMAEAWRAELDDEYRRAGTKFMKRFALGALEAQEYRARSAAE